MTGAERSRGKVQKRGQKVSCGCNEYSLLGLARTLNSSKCEQKPEQGQRQEATIMWLVWLLVETSSWEWGWKQVRRLPCSRKNWGKPVWTVPFSGSAFTKLILCVSLKCTQPVPTKAFAIHHEERSNFSNGGLFPSFKSQCAWHFLTEAFPVNSVWSQPPQKASPTTEFPSQHSTQSVFLLFIDFLKTFIHYISLPFEWRGMKRQGPCLFCSLVYPHLLAALAGT